MEEAEDAQASAVPQLIVQVQTTVANVQDVDMTATIQEELAQHHLLPEEHIVDSGYVDAELLVSSQQQHGLKLVGPVLSDNSWQAKAGKGFDVAHVHLDWQAQLATCPQGQSSSRWSLAGERIEVVFAQEVCAGRGFLGEAPWEEVRGGRARRATIKAHPAAPDRPRPYGLSSHPSPLPPLPRKLYKIIHYVRITHGIDTDCLFRRDAHQELLHRHF